MVLGIRHAFGQDGVVGQQQQSARIFIEPSDGSHKRRHFLQQVVHRRSPLGVAFAGDESGWLVKQHIEALQRLHHAAIEFNPIRIEVHPMFRVLDNCAVHCHAALMNPAPCIGARSEPRLRQNSFQRLRCRTYWLIHILFTLVNCSTVCSPESQRKPFHIVE